MPAIFSPQEQIERKQNHNKTHGVDYQQVLFELLVGFAEEQHSKHCNIVNEKIFRVKQNPADRFHKIKSSPESKSKEQKTVKHFFVGIEKIAEQNKSENPEDIVEYEISKPLRVKRQKAGKKLSG